MSGGETMGHLGKQLRRETGFPRVPGAFIPPYTHGWPGTAEGSRRVLLTEAARRRHRHRHGASGWPSLGGGLGTPVASKRVPYSCCWDGGM